MKGNSMELDFLFMVFQSNPQKDQLFFFFWIDGEKIKRIMRRDAFYELVKAKQPELLRTAYDAAMTYSFYLWSISDKTIIHLQPRADQETQYPDSLNVLMMGKPIKHLVKEKKTIEEMLMGYGFNVPSKETIGNLQATLERREPEEEGLLARFLNRRRTINKTPPRDMTK
jgi:hypothetical protein